MSLQVIFNAVVVIFTVANLTAAGLEWNAREALRTLRSAKVIALVLVSGWVVGPALALLITWLIPLMDSHAAGLLLISLAPTAPFLSQLVQRAGGDMSFAAAFILLTTLGTVLFLPLLAPVLIEGLTVDTLSLAKVLFFMVLLPLLIGGSVGFFAPNIANRLFPVVQKIGGVFLIACLVLTLFLYGRDMLGAVGSLAPGAQVLFLVVITVLTYVIGFGLERQQRSSMALGMCTRNTAAAFAVYLGIANPPSGLFVMIILIVPLAPIVAMVAARVLAQQAHMT